jgi:hypothetical protein
MERGLRLNYNLTAVKLHDLIGNDFAAFARFDFAVHFHLPIGDDFFGGAAAFTPALEFEQVAQFDVRVIIQIKSFHTALLI